MKIDHEKALIKNIQQTLLLLISTYKIVKTHCYYAIPEILNYTKGRPESGSLLYMKIISNYFVKLIFLESIFLPSANNE